MQPRRLRTADLDDREWDRVWAFASRYLDAGRGDFERSVRAEVLEMMDALARPLYGSDWDARSGVVRANGKRLRGFVSPIDEPARGNPDVRYFEERNPRHAEGEMLLCLAPLDARNCACIAVRTLARLLKGR